MELERLVAELACLAPKPDPPVPPVDPGVASKGPHAVLLGCLTEDHASSKVNTDRVRVKAMTEEELEDLVRYEQLAMRTVLSGTRVIPEPASSTALVTELKQSEVLKGTVPEDRNVLVIYGSKTAGEGNTHPHLCSS